MSYFLQYSFISVYLHVKLIITIAHFILFGLPYDSAQWFNISSLVPPSLMFKLDTNLPAVFTKLAMFSVTQILSILE